MTLLDYLTAYAESNGVTLLRATERFADRLGVATSTARHWAYGGKTPTTKMVKKISLATYGKVSIDDFANDEEEKIDANKERKGSRPPQAQV
jgi:transcriptional regulator with XRE-family HTH domain